MCISLLPSDCVSGISVLSSLDHTDSHMFDEIENPSNTIARNTVVIQKIGPIDLMYWM